MPLPVLIASRIAPMTYAVDLLRSVYYFGKPEYSKVVLHPVTLDLAVCFAVGLVFLVIGTYLFVKKERDR